MTTFRQPRISLHDVARTRAARECARGINADAVIELRTSEVLLYWDSMRGPVAPRCVYVRRWARWDEKWAKQ